MLRLPEHPDRRALLAEAHARPPYPIDSPCSVAHLSLLISEEKRDEERTLLEEFIAPNAGDIKSTHSAHRLFHSENYTFKWEKHGEFSDFTFFAPINRNDLSAPYQNFADARLAPSSALPWEWINRLPGQVVSALQMVINESSYLSPQAQISALSAHNGPLIVTQLADEGATFISPLQEINGWIRSVVINEKLSANRLGRTIQRLIEIETYRMMALLTFPVAKKVSHELSITERRLKHIIAQRSINARLAPEANSLSTEDSQLLAELTELAGLIEHSITETAYRFGAGQAYYDLVVQRMNSLHEKNTPGFSSMKGFMERRLTPAMATCRATHGRQHSLSERINRATDLLRTKVNVELEEHNQQLLVQMNRRARLQLRLQETVEGLSVVVLTYYGLMLFHYLIKGSKSQWGWPPDVDTATALALPCVAALVVFFTRRFRQKMRADAIPH